MKVQRTRGHLLASVRSAVSCECRQDDGSDRHGTRTLSDRPPWTSRSMWPLNMAIRTPRSRRSQSGPTPSTMRYGGVVIATERTPRQERAALRRHPVGRLIAELALPLGGYYALRAAGVNPW